MKVDINKLVTFAKELNEKRSDVELATFHYELFIASNAMLHMDNDTFDEDERHEIATAFYFCYKFVERLKDIITSD